MLSTLSHAFRNLGRQPLVTAVALLSIALGIGANTAIFTLLDQILLRPLPAQDPSGLVQLDLPGTRRGSTFNDRPFSYPMYKQIRDNVASYSAVWAQFRAPVSLSAKVSAQRATAAVVTGNYFTALGLQPALGRLLYASDDVTRAGHPLAVLRYGFWKEKFGGDPNVLNTDVLVNGLKFTVVGVAPQTWQGTDIVDPPDIFVPMAMKNQITPTWDGFDSSQYYFLHVFARLQPGVTPQQAKAETDAILAPVLLNELTQMPGLSEKRQAAFLGKRIVLHPAAQGNLSDKETIQTATWTLMALVGVVLLIACANVANLLLARGSSRKKEIAIRLAMGASRAQLIRQLLSESMLLAALGGLLGLLFSDWILTGIMNMQPVGGSSAFRGELDWRVLLFNLTLTVGTGLLFGLLPALQATKADVAPTLKDQAGSVVGGSAWLRKALVVGQIALSVIMLAAAGFFTKTLFELRRANPGFQTEKLLVFAVDPSLNGYKRDAAEQFHSSLQTQLAALPAARAVSMASNAVLDNSTSQRTIRIEGYTSLEGEDMNPRVNEVGAGFFKTMGIPMLLGREFRESDGGSAPKVAVVSEKFASQYFPGTNPLGRKIAFGDHSGAANITIIGVAGNIKHRSPREDATQFRFVYTPMAQASTVAEMTYYVRTTDDSANAARDVRAAVRRLDPNMPIQALRTVRDQIDAALNTERLISTLCSSFGLVATVLASIGLYGVMAFHVARRTREIGIRMALGASRGAVLGMILREVSLMALLGVGIGVPAALGLGQLVKSLLFPTEPTDPVVLTGAALLLGIVALAAGWFPARRAAQIDPMQALRYE